MNILIDVGNTRIKWCVEKKGLMEEGQAIEYKGNDFLRQIEQDWLKQTSPDVLAISSVGRQHIMSQLIELAKRLWSDINIVIAKSSAAAFSVSNAYHQAEQLGIDRWLGLIALQHYYPGNSCIASCGTAITLDCLDDKGQHLGGVIAPGVTLMKQSLSKETTRLAYTHQQYPVALADSTESAIYTGILYAATGLIEKTVKNFCLCDKFVLTGGDAQMIAQHLAFKTIIEPDFILKGLSLYCRGEKES